MGLLTVGKPLDWPDIKKHREYIKQHGINQFLNLWKRYKDIQIECLKYGDEVECFVLKLDQNTRKARLLLRGVELVTKLDAAQECSDWKPEYASYMLEATPAQPYGHDINDINHVERNMRHRRQLVEQELDEDEILLSMSVFPRLGCEDFVWPPAAPDPIKSCSRSLFFPDEAINSHPRFPALTANIRQRRGKKVAINVPIFRDTMTPSPFVELLPQDKSGEYEAARKDDHIYMDAMGFGMGLACLQITFQAVNICEARALYDNLANITPVMSAISAASPIYRGYLSDVDHRWAIIAASVDDRTDEELGLVGKESESENSFRICKSRYDTISSYLSPLGEKYNDIYLPMNKMFYEQMRQEGVDHLLAQHVAHLFIRDPISVFENRLELDDCTENEHFESIQSTNWQSLRFKPPPINTDIGWRVEFRPLDIQLTDFENAAFSVFVVLLTRVILSFQLNLLIPISKVDENMLRAQKRDAVLNEKFYFRRNIFTNCSPDDVMKKCGFDAECWQADADVVEMSANEIINGCDSFCGLIFLMQKYINTLDCSYETSCTMSQYLNFISARAAGKLKTAARWMRDYVSSHPSYKHDSVINEEVNFDLVNMLSRIGTLKLQLMYRRGCLTIVIKRGMKRGKGSEIRPTVVYYQSKYEKRPGLYNPLNPGFDERRIPYDVTKYPITPRDVNEHTIGGVKWFKKHFDRTYPYRPADFCVEYPAKGDPYYCHDFDVEKPIPKHSKVKWKKWTWSSRSERRESHADRQERERRYPPNVFGDGEDYELIEEMIPEFVVPYLTDCELKPYVNYHVEEDRGDTKPSTPDKLFDELKLKSEVEKRVKTTDDDVVKVTTDDVDKIVDDKIDEIEATEAKLLT